MRFFRSPKFSGMLPYLLFATAVILIYRAVLQLPLALGVVRWFFAVITPFFYGFLLAYTLNIPRSGLQKLFGKIRLGFFQKHQRGLSIITVYLLFFLLIFLVLRLVIPQIYTSFTFFADNLPMYYEYALYLLAQAEQYFGIELTQITQTLDFENILAFFQGFQIFDAIANVSMAVFRMVLALISSIYILIEKDAFKEYLKKLLEMLTPKTASKPILKYTDALNRNFRQYIYTQTIDGLILGTLATIQLFLMGSPYALLLGLMLGVFNYIPYFGSIAATIIAVLVVFLTQGTTMGLIAGGALLITQQIDANVIQPKLMGGSFSLSPLLVIISITVGGAIAGIFGMIAAIPVVAVLKDLLDVFIAYRQKKREAAIDGAEPANDE